MQIKIQNTLLLLLFLATQSVLVSSKTHLKAKKAQVTKTSIQSFSKIQCTAENCNGVCSSSKTCTCKPGYLDIERAPIFCSYQQKTQSAAFLLEALLPFGIGHFYMGRILFAVTKILILFTPLLILSLGKFGLFKREKTENEENSHGMFDLLMIVSGIVSIGFCSGDLLMLGMNRYSDGNNMPVLGW